MLSNEPDVAACVSETRGPAFLGLPPSACAGGAGLRQGKGVPSAASSFLEAPPGGSGKGRSGGVEGRGGGAPSFWGGCWSRRRTGFLEKNLAGRAKEPAFPILPAPSPLSLPSSSPPPRPRRRRISRWETRAARGGASSVCRGELPPPNPEENDACVFLWLARGPVVCTGSPPGFLGKDIDRRRRALQAKMIEDPPSFPCSPPLH